MDCIIILFISSILIGDPACSNFIQKKFDPNAAIYFEETEKMFPVVGEIRFARSITYEEVDQDKKLLERMQRSLMELLKKQIKRNWVTSS